jgi:hypothetical protein
MQSSEPNRLDRIEALIELLAAESRSAQLASNERMTRFEQELAGFKQTIEQDHN